MDTSKEILQKIAAANRANSYVDITPYELGFGMPVVHYSGFFSQPGECIVYATPAQTFKDKTRTVGYTGKSAGASLRIAKGFTVHTGNSGSKPIRGTVRDFNGGDLIITNKRIVFVGKDDSFDLPLKKLSAVKISDRQSFTLLCGKTQKNISMDSAVVAYAVGFISYVQKESAAGVDVYQSCHSPLTSEQLAYCNCVRQECEKMRQPKKRNSNRALWAIVKILFALIVLVAAVGIILSSVENSKNAKNNNRVSNTDTSYTVSELVYLKDHPRIFENFADVKSFYDKIGDNRIAVTNAAEKASMKKSLKNIYSDDIVLYMTQDSANKDYLGTVEINIFDKGFAANMTVERAVETAAAYLPADFFKYYSPDASYVYENDGTEFYTYSCRLNDEGIEHHNSVAPQYSYYYCVQITKYSDGAHWKITTGYSAYGGKDKGWIEKYTKPWNAPFQK